MKRPAISLLISVSMLAIAHVSEVRTDEIPQSQQTRARGDAPSLVFFHFRGGLLIDHPSAAIWFPGVPQPSSPLHPYLLRFPLTETKAPVFRSRYTYDKPPYVYDSHILEIRCEPVSAREPASIEIKSRGVHHVISFPKRGEMLRVNARRQTFNLKEGKLLVAVSPNGTAVRVQNQALREQAFDQANELAKKMPKSFGEHLDRFGK